MRLLLIGIQGSGKSTQGKLLSNHLKIPYISSGNIFRELAKEDTQWGQKVRHMMKMGKLIPDDKVIPLIEEYLSREEFGKGYILDGFPRTLVQAEAFLSPFNTVFYLQISDKEALWRISFRTESREDETVTAVRKRIELFHEQTEPLIDYFKQKQILTVINGEHTKEQVFVDICAGLPMSKS